MHGSIQLIFIMIHIYLYLVVNLISISIWPVMNLYGKVYKHLSYHFEDVTIFPVDVSYFSLFILCTLCRLN